MRFISAEASRGPRRLVVALTLAALAAPPAAAAQDEARVALTAADYARAERYLGYRTAPLVSGTAGRATWMPDGRFWYRSTTPGGSRFMLVDPARATRVPAFDHVRVAAGLAAAADTAVDADDLPINSIEYGSAGATIVAQVGSRRLRCDPAGSCKPDGGAARGGPPGPGRRGGAAPAVASPDGRRAAFIRDWNLWVRDVASGQETQLTTDGTESLGYATNNAGWTRSDNPVVVWSPDSKRIATFRHDSRGVGSMYLVSTKVGHPVLEAWKYPLPGDSAIFMIQRVVVDVDARRVTDLKMPADPHRSTLCDHVVCGGQWADVEWSPDGAQLAFVSSSRDHKEARLRVADAATGTVRDVLEEKVPTFFESGVGKVNWHVLPASNEVIWYSQRDDWGNLYLYDLRTGRLKNRITTGPGNVLQVLRVDEKARTITFTGAGREAGRDPYFRHLYRVGFDGRRATLLTPDNADHDIALSPDGRFFVDTWSRPDMPPVSVLRSADGRVVLPLEKADISRLVATGWTPPIPVTVKARDGKTDLYGLLYRPTGFDSTKRYPIVNQIYPGPQTGSVGSRSFNPSRGDTRAIAELGFVVLQLDAMGTPMRSKSFHTAYYGNMGDNGLPDQITGMKQLAERYRWIDIDRAGIYGHSGGGYAAAGGILRYPDFFKVAVSQAGNHDQRNYEDDWGEKWQGLLEKRDDGTTSYDDQANISHVANLKGKLLIAHGSMDNNVPPSNSLVLVDALIKANKDFDFIEFPNRRHGFGSEPYMMRRRWDYFVKHLLGAEPPREFEFNRTPPPQP